MSNVFFSPEGNPEVWEEKPEAYFTPEEWTEMHSTPSPFTPGPNFIQRDNGEWYKVRYTRKEFVLWCGMDKFVALNHAIVNGNVLLLSLRTMMEISEYISLLDDDTKYFVTVMTTPEGGNILTDQDAVRILTGEKWIDPNVVETT